MPPCQPPAEDSDDSLLPPLFSRSEWRRIVSALRLSPRMAQIAELVMRTAQDKQITVALGIRQSTLRTHLTHLTTRLGVSGRCELMYRVFATYRREIEGHQQR